jgi:hypothetical protein
MSEPHVMHETPDSTRPLALQRRALQCVALMACVFAAWALGLIGCMVPLRPEGLRFWPTNERGWASDREPRVDRFEPGETVMLALAPPSDWDEVVVTVVVRHVVSGRAMHQAVQVVRPGEVFRFDVTGLATGAYVAELSAEAKEIARVSFLVKG